MSAHQLQASARTAGILRAELLKRFPELGEDEQTLLDSLEGMSDIKEQIAYVAESVEADDYLAAAIGVHIARLSQRATRLEHRAEKKRDAILSAMMEAGIPKLQLPTVTLSQVQNPPSVVITDETKVTDEYKVFPDPPEPRIDKKTILADLKSGKQLDFAVLSNPSKRLGWYSK